MKKYRSKLDDYLNDLGAKRPSPGGGSVASLIFCLGLSLIEKAINYSNTDDSSASQVKQFKAIRKKISIYIDLDGEVFRSILRARGENRARLLEKSEKIIIDTASCCVEAFSLAKEAESGIKKSIISDFLIGREALKVAFKACVINLEANSKLFGKASKHIARFREILEQWQ